jgi:hypothetical protein
MEAMTPEGLTPGKADELLRRQQELQLEAGGIIRDLDLVTHLSLLGDVEHIGSSASGLMVWRDIDLGVRCRDLSLGRVWETLMPILTDPRVVALDYRNETEERSPSGLPADQRYYIVLRYETAAGHEWKIDLSLWLSYEPRGQLEHVAELRRRLTDETRLAILWIKDVWHTRPVYPYKVGGTDVYDAVLEHGVRTPTEFDAYLHERGMQ